MSKKKESITKVVLKAFAAIFVLLLLLNFLIVNLGTTYSEKFFSQNGKYYAQVEETNGGATTGFISGVTITNTRYFFNNSVLLSVWSGNSKNVFGFNGSLDSVKPEWIDNNTLKVTYSDCSKIYGQDASWENIKIIYQGECPKN